MLKLIKAGVAILISDRADFRARKVFRNKVGHFVMMKESILQENKNPCVFVSNNRGSKYER